MRRRPRAPGPIVAEDQEGGRGEHRDHPERRDQRGHLSAEREGFEPSRELSAPYSLSRRVPSAARPPLRGRSQRATSGTIVGWISLMTTDEMTAEKPPVDDETRPVAAR